MGANVDEQGLNGEHAIVALKQYLVGPAGCSLLVGRVFLLLTIHHVFNGGHVVVIPGYGSHGFIALFFGIGNEVAQVHESCAPLAKLLLVKMVAQDGLHLQFKLGHLSAGFLSHFENVARNGGIYLGAGDFFEQTRFFIAARPKEVGKTVLSQQHSSRKLLIVEAYDVGHHIGLDSLRVELFGKGRKLSECALGRVVAVVAIATHRPGGFIAGAILGYKDKGTGSLLFAAPQQVTHVMGFDAQLAIGALNKVFFSYSFYSLEARGTPIESQTNGIENGGLSCPRVARNGKKTGRAQRFGREVNDLLSFERGKIFYDDFFDFHEQKRLLFVGFFYGFFEAEAQFCRQRAAVALLIDGLSHLQRSEAPQALQ